MNAYEKDVAQRERKELYVTYHAEMIPLSKEGERQLSSRYPTDTEVYYPDPDDNEFIEKAIDGCIYHASSYHPFIHHPKQPYKFMVFFDESPSLRYKTDFDVTVTKTVHKLPPKLSWDDIVNLGGVETEAE